MSISFLVVCARSRGVCRLSSLHDKSLFTKVKNAYCVKAVAFFSINFYGQYSIKRE